MIYQRLFCGVCRYCLGGRQDLCRNSRVLGEHGGGGYAEFACVPARNAIPIPDGLETTTAALAVCPSVPACARRWALRGLGPGQTVLITGAGGGLGLTRSRWQKRASAGDRGDELAGQGRDRARGRRG